MSAGRICTREVHLAFGPESVREAARRMDERRVGSLVVLDDERRPIGILTDRDVALRIVAAGRDPASTTVEQVMSTPPRPIAEDTPIERALWLLRAWGVRRAPVVDGAGRLRGLLALDDVVALLAGELHVAAQLLSKQGPTQAEAGLDERVAEVQL